MNFDSFYNSNPNLKLKLLRDLVLKYKGFITGAEIENDFAIFGNPDFVKTIEEIKNNANYQSMMAALQKDTEISDKERYILERFTGSMMGSYLAYDLLTNPSVYPDYALIKDEKKDPLNYGGMLDSLAVIFEPLGVGENFPDVLIRKTDTDYYSMKNVCNTVEINNDKLLTKIIFDSLSQEQKEKVVDEFNIKISAVDYYEQPGEVLDSQSSRRQDINLFYLKTDTAWEYQLKNQKWYTRRQNGESKTWIELTPERSEEAIEKLNRAYDQQLIDSQQSQNGQTDSNVEKYTIQTFSSYLADNPQRMPYFLNDQIDKIQQSPVNESVSAPTEDKPNLASFIIKKNAYSKSTRNDNYLSIFFGAVSQLELSRCTPYLSLTFFNKKDLDEKHSDSLSNVSYMRFEKDSFGEFKSTWMDIKSEKTPNFINEKEEEINNIGYMDLFTSPQTMVNANINKSSNGNNAFGFGGTSGNTDFINELGNVLDPFAPMMSLKNFNATINGGGDFMITNRRAKLTVTLHDRSRLQDIAPLISLNQLARTVVKVEHGWSHPDGDPIRSDNDIGKFLNSLRETHIYQLTSSDFSFSGNQVDINMTLDFFGATDFKTTSIGLGNQKKDKELTNLLIELINDMEKNNRIATNDDPSNNTGNPTMHSLYGNSKEDKKRATSIHKSIAVLRNSAMSIDFLLPADKVQELTSRIKKIKIKSENGEIVETFNHADIIKDYFGMLNIMQIGDEDSINSYDLVELLEGGITDQLFEKVKQNIAERIITKVDSACDSRSKKTANGYQTVLLTDDPYRDPLCWAYSENLEKNAVIGYPAGHVSLGKLITNLIALPLASGGENKYTEVQVLFYPINNQAAGARKFTTASIPVDIKAFKSMIYKTVKGENDLTTRGLFDLLSNYFQNDNLEIYGLDTISKSSIFKRETEIKESENFEKNAFKRYKTLNGKEPQDDKQKEAAKDSYLKSKLKKFKSESLKSTLEQIYENDGIGIAKTDRYKKPVIHLELEVVSAIVPSDASVVNDASILELYSNYFKDGVLSADISKVTGVDDNKKILKIHVYDENCTSRPAETMFMEGLVDPERYMSVAGNLKHAKADDNLNNVIKEFSNSSSKHIEKLSLNEIKQYVKRSFPSITYGSQQAVVKSINVSSNTSDEIIHARLMNSIYKKEQKTESTVTKELPVQKDIEEFIIPTSIDMSIYGCPFITMGLNVFIDLGTGTDIDNVYMVGDVSHTISAGEYSTNVSLYLPQIGTTKQLKSKLIGALESIDTEKLKENLSKSTS